MDIETWFDEVKHLAEEVKEKTINSSPFHFKYDKWYHRINPKKRKAMKIFNQRINDPAFVREVYDASAVAMTELMVYGRTVRKK